ncbi:MAG: restriction endonuclease subunit S [Lysobacteraceae bacterium]|nr:MAG: restriction endonuclease subunit S [Xanthomonadaceae bacterium]
MAKQGTKMVTPRLRFPEFRDAGAWTSAALGTITCLVTERVGSTECVPYTVTSGLGLVSQQEKLGRTIAGQSLKNYLVLQQEDFAYNKSATKAYPQGYIARYDGSDRAAVPNSIFTCFRIKDGDVHPIFLENLFVSNLHGDWLRGRIAVGARAHGSLNVSDNDLMALPIPLPPVECRREEQQKIADCLTSLDEVIAAQGRKVEALKAHKRGLMQQLFPHEGETRPRLRFPEFRNAPEWRATSVGAWSKSFSGGTPATTRSDYYGGAIPFIRSAEIESEKIELSLTETGLKASSAKLVERGDVLLALYGANSGDVALARTSGAINQAILCIRPHGSRPFLYHYLTALQPWLVATYLQGGQGNLSGEIVKSVGILVPSNEEQQRVAVCLTSLDARINAETDRLASLKTHKQGLMQQLFPAPEALSA